jgi:hypothetical protein
MIPFCHLTLTSEPACFVARPQRPRFICQSLRGMRLHSAAYVNAGTSNCRCGLGRARALAFMEQGGAWGRRAYSGAAITRAFQKYVFSFTCEYFSRCEHALLLLRRLREAEVEKGSLVKEALVHPLTTFSLDLFTRH